MAHKKGCETTLPVKKKAAARKIEHKTVLVLRVGDKIALRRRPDKGLLSGLFEPYGLEGTHTAEEVTAALTALGLTPTKIRPLGKAKHVFSHLEWHMAGFEVKLEEGDQAKLPEGVLLASRDEIDTAYALPSAYRAYRAHM